MSLPRIALILLLLILGSAKTQIYAQTIKIKVLNGRNGKPINGSYVNVWVGAGRMEAMAIPINKAGFAQLQLTDNEEQVDQNKYSKECSEPCVIDP